MNDLTEEYRENPALVTQPDMAKLFGVSKQAVSQWVSRRGYNNFPLPVGRVRSRRRRFARVYDRKEVELWRATYRPSHGRGSLRA